jgi:uncharacterized membrane protein
MKIKPENLIRLTKRKYSGVAILLAIVILGAGLRLYHLGANPFVADEFLDLNSAYGYAQTHVWQAWDFNLNKPNIEDVFAPRDERAWPYKWQVAQVFKIFPLSEASARMVSVLWGILSILIVYWTARYFSKRKVIGLLSAFLFAVSVTAIAFDRKLRMYAMFYPLYLLLSLFLYQFFEEDYAGKIRIVKYFYQKFKVNILYLLPLLLAAFASWSIQLLTVNIVPVFGTYVLIRAAILAGKKDYLNKYSATLALGVVAGVGAYLIMPQTVMLYIGSLTFFINNQEYFIRIMADYSNYLLAAIMFFSGVFFFYRQKFTKQALWLVLSFFVPLLMAAFLWKRTQGIQYVFYLQSFMIIMIASGIYFWARFLTNHMTAFPKRVFWITMITALLILPDYGYFWGSDTTYHRDTTQVADYRKALAYVKKNLKPGDLLITRHFRNYYLKGANANIFDFGGERAQADLSLATVQSLVQQYPSGWVVVFDDDDQFLSNQALNYIKNNMVQTDVSAIRGAAKAYRWGTIQQ